MTMNKERDAESLGIVVEEKDTTYRLPCGYKDNSGVIHREFEVREMNGSDEEAIADPKISQNSARIITTLIKRCVKRIGTIEPITDEVARDLIIGDRDFILLKIRIASMGPEIDMSITCPVCKEKQVIMANLDTTDVLVFEDSAPREKTVTLAKGCRDKEGVTHKEVTMKLPTGVDQELLVPIYKKNPGLANTTLLTRCIKQFGTMKAFDTTVIRELSIKDRDILGKALRDFSPGPKMDVNVVCTSCANEFIAPMELGDFFVKR